MAQRLTMLRVDEVSVVDRPANSRRFLILKAAATKTEDGEIYTADDYAYVPDPDKPSAWKLRLKEYVDGGKRLTAAQVGRAIAALSPGGFRGNPVEIPKEDPPAVKARVRRAWREANPDKNPGEMPEVIRKDRKQKPSLVSRAIRSLRKTAGETGLTTEVEEMTAEDIGRAIDHGVAAALRPIEERITQLEETEGGLQSALDEEAHQLRKKAGFWEGSGLLL